MNEEAIKQAIQHGIQQALQPLLERIDELERVQESDAGHIWKLNALIHVLMMAFPAEHAQAAIQELQERLDEPVDGQSLGFREMEIVRWQKQLERLLKPRCSS